MSTDATITDRLAGLRPTRENLLIALLIVNSEVLLLGVYWLVSPSELTSLSSIRYWLYPFVWINVGLWAILKTTPSPSPSRDRWLAGGIAVAYFAVLAYAGGLVGPASSMAGRSLRVTVLALPPGWAPTLIYNGDVLSAALFPFKLVGYVALAYLVYATVLDAAGSAVTGLLGLLSCVSCSWPVLASLATGLLGSGSALAGAVYTQSYGLSTLVFVVTVGLLYWRPFGR
ncbi:DUF7546 family protein [Halorientalis pallida]|uniref:Uncharacterized protein n=1 Tax=Halorientalis pallida TaxID=2479928 RepID=A0A498KVE2_9EURY|nr:hypothetical protein [Halorientalis pallida]RXK49209.1 hypothetical protein EAF64_09825 [Halorientalis pallida]